MFHHMKCLKDWTIKNNNVLIIVCCGMHYEDGVAYNLFWENLNAVMSNDGLSNVKFNGSMADDAQSNWNLLHVVYFKWLQQSRRE